MAKTNHYPRPVQTASYADSITIREWHATKHGDGQVTQWTKYQGAIEDLIAVGLVPREMYVALGRSGVKSGFINGERIELRRAGKALWRVDRRHPYGELPYESHKARCTAENGELRDPDAEAREREALAQEIGYSGPHFGQDAGDRIESRVFLDVNPPRMRAIYEGTREQLIRAGLASPSMFPERARKKAGDNWHTWCWLTEHGQRWAVVYENPVTELPPEVRQLARREMIGRLDLRGFARWARRNGY